MLTEHGSVGESKKSFLEQFEEGIEGDSWMAAVWTLKPVDPSVLEDADEYIIRKTTSNFPKSKYLGALFSLKNLLDREIAFELANVRQPLPLASHLRKKDDEAGSSQKENFERGVFPGKRPNKLPGKITALHEVNDESEVEEKEPFTPEISPFPELNTESNHEEENKSDEESV